MKPISILEHSFIGQAHRSVFSRVGSILPGGLALSDDAWSRRHQWLLNLLVLHAVGVACFGLIMHDSPSVAFSESTIVAGFAALAAMKRLDRRMRASLVTIGLVSASSALVHLSGGYIEAHFHFFIILVFIILYHDWLPFLLALGVTALHHGIMGTLAPSMVYNHPAAIASPWLWAGIHAGAVLAESVGILIYWRLHETDALELRRSEALVTSIVAHLPDMLFVKDAKDLSFVRLNKVGEELLGLSQSECLGKTDYDIFTKEEADFFTAKDREVLDRGLLDISEEPIQTKDKGVRILHTKRVPILDDAGRPRYLVGISDDITERKRMEDSLRGSEQRFHSAFDHAPIGMALVSPDGRWLRVNRSLREIVGYSEAELLASDFQTITHPEDLEADLNQARELLAGGIHKYQMEKRYFHKDGHVVHILLAVSLVRDTEGQPLYFISQIEDISERKHMELAIAESRSHFQAVLDAATEVSIIATDLHGIITVFNAGAEGMLGYRADDMVGKQTLAIIHVEDEVTAYGRALTAELGRPVGGFDVFVERARTVGAEEREWTYLRKDGSRLPVSLTVTALRNGQSNITGYLGIAKDISDRKRADEAVRQQQFFLKERLKEANCLYAVSRLMGDDALTIDQLVQGVVALLPPAFQHPESICARITLEEREFTTPAYVETAWKQSAPICVRANEVGRVEVCCHTDQTPVDENPFLMEECHLIEAVAQRIGDVLTRKQAETALREQEARLRAIVDNAVDGIITIDERGTIESFNPAAERLFGYTAAEMIGHNVKRLMPEPYQSDYDGYLARYRRTGKTKIIGTEREVIGLRKDGSIFPLDFTAGAMSFCDRHVFVCTIRDITQWKTAELNLEKAARNMEARNHELAQAQALAHVGSWEWDVETGAEVWSDEQFRIFGYEPQIITPTIETFREALHPDDRARVFAAVEDAFVHGKPYEVVCRIIRSSGESRYVQCRGRVIRDTAGNPKRMMGTVQDITELKSMDVALRESERRLALAMQAGNIGLFDHDQVANRLYWSPTMYRMLGRSEEEVASIERYVSTIRQEDREAVLAKISQAHDPVGDGVFSVEHPVLSPDGTMRWFSLKSQTSFEGEGTARHAVRTIGTIIDITERKQMEESLRDKEELFRTFLDFAPSAMFMKTTEGRYVLTNQYFEQVCRSKRESIVGKTDAELFPRDIADQYRANDRQVLEAGQAIEFEETSRNDNGLDTNIVVKFPVRDRAGRIYATGGIATNITARKEMESKLEQSAFEWECQNIELIAVHKELVAVHEQALAATRAKSQFLASMSHEIRTPMNAIIAMAELLQETPLSKEQQEYVGRFSRAATSLLDLINDILDISKIEAGHVDLESIAFDIHDLIDKVAELMAVRCHAKQLELVAFVHPSVPTWMLGDPTRLRQVFVNLVGNAIKFTERGEVVIRVEPDEADPTTLRCSVSDTGIGIPADKVGAIFESFTQVDSSTTRRYGGTGLGLSISKRLVELMGGHIGVRSEEGLGSKFSFVVRLQKTSPPATAPALPALNLQGLRLLVVDDKESNRMIVREHLMRLGPVIIEAANGSEALTALDAAQQHGQLFNVAILDYQMPGMDGLELAQTIRERKDCPSLPLVMHASDMRGQPSQRARELGIAAYAYKPVSRMRLLESLSVALRQAPAAPALQTPVSSGPEPTGLAPLRILLAEDLEDNRAIVRLFLKDTPYTIEEAENGLIALQKFQAGTYDLVFMDMQMPVMGGLEATVSIRAWEREQQRAPTPILALTANAFKEELDKTLAAGCTAHLTKPIKKKTLLAAIVQYANPPSGLAA